MISRIFFDLEIGGRKYSDLYVDLKQTPGADYETAPLEVGPPHGYDGVFNHHEFRREVEEYYRQSFGSRGSGIRISGGSNIRMFNNTFACSKVIEFKIK
jgi:hypothetical protein